MLIKYYRNYHFFFFNCSDLILLKRLLLLSCNSTILIFLFALIDRSLMFLNSMLSATAEMGLFKWSKFFILIIDLLDTIFPFHLLGLKGLIGVTASFSEFKLKIGPCTERLYAVLPAGVDIKIPSPINFFTIVLFPIFTFKDEACLLCLSKEISLIAIISFLIFFFIYRY